MLRGYGQLIGVICLLVFSAWGGHEWSNRDWSQRWAERDAIDASTQAAAAEDALARQQKLLQELDNAYKEQKELKENHDRNVSDSRAAADRLRVELNRIKALPAITNTSTIAERANAATNSRVLAELLKQSDYLAGKYAEEADEHRVALAACRAEYDTVLRSLSL